MDKSKMFVIVILSVLITFIGFMIYKVEFKKKIETRHYVNEILKLKIDSCHIQKYSNQISYEFFISNKYRATIDSVKFVPFKCEEKVDIDVRNILGEMIIYDWTGSYWQSDMDKLMNYLTDYSIEYQRNKIIKSNYLKIDSLWYEKN